MLPLPPELEGRPDALGAVAATRAWMADPARTPEERAAFEAHTRAMTLRYMPWLAYAIAGGALLWWPTDWIVYADDPELRAGFAVFRAQIIALHVGLSLTLPRIAVVQRHAHLAAALAALLSLSVAGWSAAGLGRGDPLWLAFGFIMPLFAIVLLIPLRARALTTAAFALSGCLAWALHPASVPGEADALSVLSYMGFSVLLSIGIGHGLFTLVRRAFYLRQRVERQREALSALAGRLEQRVAEQTRDIREMHRRAQSLRAEQRVELARDLHDGLGQELTSLRLLVGLGQQLSAHGQAEDVLSELDGQVSRVQQSLRHVLQALRPQNLVELGFAEAVRELVGELERRSGLRITFTMAEDVPEPLPQDHGLTLYRIAQEGLNNALRHARARRIELRLSRQGDALLLELEDDGVGLPPERLGAGLGTRGVVERAEALGGSARWSSEGGTCLHVTLPLPPP
ncbi:MAG: sensor histidine kinase [Alphaproteobacteria bacterium]|nr:sensor histidine kinase [Alphaproteobacteria bacterium]